MRDIKFRAWDKDTKEMLAAQTMEQLLTKSPLLEYEVDCLELMQYTGLEDNNGVEIYEGDIIKKGIGTSFPTNCLVKWLNDGWVAGAANLHPLMSNKVLVSRCEIIGNIYVSPELLED
ncbi:MAG: YopX family protein [Nitrosomonadaceae bacterium]